MLVIAVAGGSGGTRLVRRGLLDVLSTIGELLLILSVLVRSQSLVSHTCTSIFSMHVRTYTCALTCVYPPPLPTHTHAKCAHTQLTLT